MRNNSKYYNKYHHNFEEYDHHCEDDDDEESCSSFGSPREIERMNLDLRGMSSDLKKANILCDCKGFLCLNTRSLGGPQDPEF